jgi:hypothetical protein
MRNFEMVDRILQAFQHRFLGFYLRARAFEQVPNVCIQMAEQFTALFIRDIRSLQLMMKFFKKFTKILIVHGKASPFLGSAAKSISILQRFEPVSTVWWWISLLFADIENLYTLLHNVYG